MQTGRTFRTAALAAVATTFVLGAQQLGRTAPEAQQFSLASTIAFVSTRDAPDANPFSAAEIYIMNGDGSEPARPRLTHDDFGDGFPSLSPDGKKIVFDSNRLRAAGEPQNTDSLFVMDADGENLMPIVYRGSSASWSPDSRYVAYHASASGTGTPIKADPGAATSDSDIFVVNVDDALNGTAVPKNITTNPLAIDDDPDWSPGGSTIVFTSHDATDNPNNSATAEIYAINADGSGTPLRLTYNSEEERAPAWSPDGTRILYMCRRGQPLPGSTLQTFELCVMNADGSGVTQITTNAVAELTPTWSPDGSQIAFHRNVAGRFQIFFMNADGTGLHQVTNTPGLNAFANWGERRVRN